MSNIFDTHCHPQFPQYDKDREEIIRRASDEEVSIICVGTDLKTSEEGITLAQKYKNMWATIGIHPNNLDEFNGIGDYEKLLKQDKVIAIGEVGLDYYRTSEIEKQKIQKEVFEQFINLAIKHKKPMVLHFRDSSKGSAGRAHKDALEILPKDIAGVSHSFTGNLTEAKEYVNRGMYLGFNGIITFARQYDEVVKYAPLENILLETDAPYLTPEPYRGQRNEPLYVIEVAKKVAELKNISIDEVIIKTTQNVINLFKINA
ncbi:MAG: TatD family hydrolase [Patescibacteria group bacterium]